MLRKLAPRPALTLVGRRAQGVASSDATNISSSIVRDGDEYVLNGHKWYISGAMRKTCKILVFLGKTPNPAMKSHEQQSMILCPMWNDEGTETYPGESPFFPSLSRVPKRSHRLMGPGGMQA